MRTEPRGSGGWKWSGTLRACGSAPAAAGRGVGIARAVQDAGTALVGLRRAQVSSAVPLLLAAGRAPVFSACPRCLGLSCRASIQRCCADRPRVSCGDSSSKVAVWHVAGRLLAQPVASFPPKWAQEGLLVLERVQSSVQSSSRDAGQEGRPHPTPGLCHSPGPPVPTPGWGARAGACSVPGGPRSPWEQNRDTWGRCWPLAHCVAAGSRFLALCLSFLRLGRGDACPLLGASHSLLKGKSASCRAPSPALWASSQTPSTKPCSSV